MSDSSLDTLIVTLCWALRELITAYLGARKRRLKGYGGFCYSVPPNERKTPVDGRRPKR